MDLAGSWFGWYVLSGASTHCPTAAVFNSRLYVFVKGASSNGLYYGYFTTGGSWNGWYVLPGASTQAPFPVVFKDFLYVLVKAASTSSLYDGYMNVGGSWSNWYVLPSVYSTDRPTAAVFNNRLYGFIKILFYYALTGDLAGDNLCYWYAGEA
jgi:hypothetical protein